MREKYPNRKTSARKRLLLALLAVSPAFAQPGNWQIEVVDTSGPGKFASLQFDASGNGHLAYVAEDGSYSLKYGFWDVALKRWFTMPVARGAAFCTLVLDSRQRPHISFTDSGSASGSKLRYAYWDAKSWKTQAVPLADDVIAFYTSILLHPDGAPMLSFYEYEGPRGTGFLLKLRTVTLKDGYWEARTIDPTPGSGKFNSIAIGSDGNPRAAYANVKDENASLRYAWWDGAAWKREIIEGQNQPVYVYSVAFVLDRQNEPHIVYTDVRSGQVKYATRRDGRWQLETVDAISKEAYPDRNGITLDSEGTPYVSYYDVGAGVLKVGHRTRGRWITEEVDRNGAGFTSAIQVRNDQVWVVYADESTRVLKCARRDVGEQPQAPEPDTKKPR